MSTKVEKILALATKFEKIAIDIAQPPEFEKDYLLWKAMQEEKEQAEADKETSKKWLEEHRRQFFEPIEEHVPYEADDGELEATAKAKDKKLDPKAKVRNRGNVCVPAESAKDKKDHFPINSIDQARNALARVHQYSSVPEWYSGSLKGLQALVSRKVHSKYPAIGKEKKSSK